jgi:hypothetical protein
MLVVPLDKAVIVPLGLTVATFGFEEDQVTL